LADGGAYFSSPAAGGDNDSLFAHSLPLLCPLPPNVRNKCARRHATEIATSAKYGVQILPWSFADLSLIAVKGSGAHFVGVHLLRGIYLIWGQKGKIILALCFAEREEIKTTCCLGLDQSIVLTIHDVQYKNKVSSKLN
jgi:hypothetical protein